MWFVERRVVDSNVEGEGREVSVYFSILMYLQRKYWTVMFVGCPATLLVVVALVRKVKVERNRENTNRQLCEEALFSVSNKLKDKNQAEQKRN
jgi:hypothetical protein